MEERIKSLLNEVNEFAENGKQALENFRMKFISRKGVVSELFEELKRVPSEQKKTVGKNPQPAQTGCRDKIGRTDRKAGVGPTGRRRNRSYAPADPESDR
jgi:phenylalanyl-tRNA synthetase alpha subunit